MTDSTPHQEPEIFHLSVARTDEILTLVRKADYERLEEQLEALQAAVDDAALVFVDTMWFNAYNHLASAANASLNNRCDRPGCESRATSGYLVGLGGMVAYYCADHAPVPNPASRSHDDA